MISLLLPDALPAATSVHSTAHISHAGTECCLKLDQGLHHRDLTLLLPDALPAIAKMQSIMRMVM